MNTQCVGSSLHTFLAKMGWDSIQFHRIEHEFSCAAGFRALCLLK